MNLRNLENKWWFPIAEISDKKQVTESIFKKLSDSYFQGKGTYKAKFDDDGFVEWGLIDWNLVAIQFVMTDLGMSYCFMKHESVLDVERAVNTEEVGMCIDLLVKTYEGKIAYINDCRLLCDDSREAGNFALDEECVDVFHYHGDGEYALKDECSYVNNWGEWFITDAEPECVHWSDWNDDYIDEHGDEAHWGYTGRRGEGWFESDEAYNVDGEWYANGDVCDDRGLYWSDRYDEYRSVPDRDEHNASYQSLTRTFRFTPNTKFGIGFEIEKEDCDAYEDVNYSGLYDTNKWMKEDDSSLCDDTGYELITPAFDLFTSDMDNDIKESSELRTLIDADYSTNCGGHVTLSSSEHSANELLEGVGGFIPLFYSLYNGRMECDYCRPKKKWEYHRAGGRGAVNLRGNKSVSAADGNVFGAIEFRMFSAVQSVKNLMWRRDLLRIVANNINSSERDVLRMLMNPSSLLFKHLIKVYSVERIVDKISLFVSYSKDYNATKLNMPDLEALRKKLKNGSNDESTSELGA
tara:strand:+ start:833 stop:2398 length:1566 start_codon:yes stop_codon:yes gene_type:complete